MHFLSLIYHFGISTTLLTGTFASPIAQNEAAPSSEPCAQARDEAAAFTAAHGPDTRPTIAASLAQACLKSIPFKSEPARALLGSLRAYIEIQSTNDYLRSPPEGYLYEAVDLPSELALIEDKIDGGRYVSEYDYQLDLQATFIMARDGHLAFSGDMLSLFSWQRPGIALAAMSSDGVSIPQIYNLDDLVTRNDTAIASVNNDSISPIIKINDVDISDFMQAAGYAHSIQDPDAAWNTEFFTLQRGGRSNGFFGSPSFYPGESTVLAYANGTVQTINNLAVVKKPLANITSGADIYHALVGCLPSTTDSECDSSETQITVRLKAREASAPVPKVTRLPFYPPPILIDPSGAVSGYYLQGQALDDVAVLAIAGFSPPSSNFPSDDAFNNAFQGSIQAFLAAAATSGKNRLILDLQGNGGGIVDLALDTYMQLFPQSDGPNSKANMRASVGMEVMMRTAATRVDQAEPLNAINAAGTDRVLTPFAYQTVMSLDQKPFNDTKGYFGPYQDPRGLFTSAMQPNWTSNEPSELGLPGVTITGTNERAGLPQHFEANNIVILTDGFCASSCTILSELLKTHQQVKSFTLGGRPQPGPMQASGGVKGSQLFSSQVFSTMVGLLEDSSAEDRDSLVGTIWESFTSLPINRSESVSVNGRNAFRMGDDSNTALQFVYEASDCRLFNDLSMLTDPTAIWTKVAKAAFASDGKIDESYCVSGSAKHATSVSGGLVPGQLGPQTPPTAAKARPGWLVDGAVIKQGSGVGAFTE